MKKQLARLLRKMADSLDKPAKVDTMPCFYWDIPGAKFIESDAPTASLTITTSASADDVFKVMCDVGLYSLDDGLEGDYVG